MKQPKRGQNLSSKRSRRRDSSADSSVSADLANSATSARTAEPVASVAAAEQPSVVEKGRNSETELTVVAAATAATMGREAPEGNDSTRTNTTSRSQAEQIVKEHLPLAVGAGMLPVPGFDLAAIGALQLKLLASLAQHYKVRFTQAQAQRIVSSLLGSVGTTLLTGAVLGSVAKFVPFFGTLVGAASMPVAAGLITRAMGNLAIDHFAAGGTMETFDLDVAQQAFVHKIAEAKAALA